MSRRVVTDDDARVGRGKEEERSVERSSGIVCQCLWGVLAQGQIGRVAFEEFLN
jgi:hypothetical protein